MIFLKERIRSLINPNTESYWDNAYNKQIDKKQLRVDEKGLQKIMHLFNEAGSILDFGSGLGGNIHYLSKQLKNTRFYLVDHSAISLDFAKNELLGEKDDNGNHFSYLPDLISMENDSLDLVMSSQVLEHITDYKFYMDRLWELVIPGGVFLISVPVLGIRDRHREHVNKFTLGSMFKLLVNYNELVHVFPRSYTKRSGRLSTAYFYVFKPSQILI